MLASDIVTKTQHSPSVQLACNVFCTALSMWTGHSMTNRACMLSSPGTHLPYCAIPWLLASLSTQLQQHTRSAGQLLFDLGHCIDDKRVQAKGPQQSICCTKSYHGLRDFARVDEALQRLVYALWPRLLEVSAAQPVPQLHVTPSSAALLPHSSSQLFETEKR